MTVTYNKLANTTIASGASALITNASGYTTYIKSFTIYNSNTTTETVDLYRVEASGGSVGTANDNTNRFLTLTLLAGQMYEWNSGINPGKVLEDANDTIQGKTTTTAKVTFSADGVKETV